MKINYKRLLLWVMKPTELEEMLYASWMRGQLQTEIRIPLPRNGKGIQTNVSFISINWWKWMSLEKNKNN